MMEVGKSCRGVGGGGLLIMLYIFYFLLSIKGYEKSSEKAK